MVKQKPDRTESIYQAFGETNEKERIKGRKSRQAGKEQKASLERTDQ